MKILFIGGGNMATALIGGMLRQGFPKSGFQVVDVSVEACTRVAAMGVKSHTDFSEVAAADIVVFAVKPQQLKEAAETLGPTVSAALVVSIAAGIRTSDLSRWLGGHRRVVRVMPNTPALIGAGVSGIFATGGVSAADRAMAERILGTVGSFLWFEQERQLDAVTAVSGSGPAYVFYFIEALEDAASELGLDPSAARKLAIATFAGAAKLAEGSDDAPAVLRANVTSKGGTTEAALASMEAAKVKTLIVEAVKAAERRARELGDMLGND